MQIEYTGQPLVSSRSLTITLPIREGASSADQRTFRHRLEVIRDELGISCLWPVFDKKTIKVTPTPPSRARIFPKQMKSILKRLEVPAELGFANDGNA